MNFEEFAQSRTRRTLTEGGRLLRGTGTIQRTHIH